MSSKDTLLAKEKQRAQAEADHQKSFTVRNYSLYIVAILIMVIGGIISALTEGWHLQNKFGSIGIAIFGVGAIEFISIYFGGSVVQDIRNGIFSADGISKALFVFKLGLYVGATYFSISLTLDGAPDFYAFHKEQKAPPMQYSLDSVRQIYQAQTDSLRVSLRKLENTTWKGKIVTDVRPTIAMLNQQIIQVDQQKQAALEETKQENQLLQKEWDDTLKEDQKIVLGFAGLGEILKISAIILIALFKEGRDQELGIHKLESAIGIDLDGDGVIGTPEKHRKIAYRMTPASSETPHDLVSEPTPTPRRPIGFIHYPTPATAEPDTSHSTEPGWPPVATGADWTEADADVMMMAYKHAKSSCSKWEAKKKNGLGTTATNDKHIAKWQKHIAHLEQRMKEQGVAFE